MKAKTCQNCCRAKEATASNRTILICSHKQGCEGKFFVVGPEDGCGNFQHRNSGRETPPPPQSDGAKLIPLTQGKFAIVDAEDYERLSKYKWYTRKSDHRLYAYRSKERKSIGMHRDVMNAAKGFVVDHIDGDGLNNRKSNLRLCTWTENSLNKRPRSNGRSRYKGLAWQKRTGKWEVRITKCGKRRYLGTFDDEMEAAIAYDRKAEVLFGEFAYLNFPQLVEFRKWTRKIIFGASNGSVRDGSNSVEDDNARVADNTARDIHIRNVCAPDDISRNSCSADDAAP